MSRSWLLRLVAQANLAAASRGLSQCDLRRSEFHARARLNKHTAKQSKASKPATLSSNLPREVHNLSSLSSSP